MPLIRVPFDAFKEVEKLLKYRFWDKERERSNHAAALAEQARAAIRSRAICPLRHQTIAWSGPPHDKIRNYICLNCYACACEPEIKDRGFDFETIPDWELDIIFDLDLQRQVAGNTRMFNGLGGNQF